MREPIFTSCDGQAEYVRRAPSIKTIYKHPLAREGVGSLIAGLDSLSGNMKVFDFQTQRWSQLTPFPAALPIWSRNGRFLYFLRAQGEPGVYRIRASGGEVERIVDLKGFRHTGVYGTWMGLDPEDTPLLLRDIGTDDIYALTLSHK